ncbi:MAG: O-phosphoserine--tRNA ligase [bacterium]|nr:O-phosphoserine--tRNA ligase [bacterium]
MKLLLLHCDRVEYELTTGTKEAEEITPEVPHKNSLGECLLVYVTVEERDASNLDEVVRRAAGEIVKIYDMLDPKRVVLNPYAHLVERIAPPRVAMKAMQGLEIALSAYDVLRCPSGWYKRLLTDNKGHPLSVLGRSIDLEAPSTPQVEMGKAHPVCALNENFRQVFLGLGLNEIINPMIVDERDVYLQYGPESPLILDRIFYLAGLDRADVGLPESRLRQIREIIPDFDKVEQLQAFLRDFKEGKVEADDFIEELVVRLAIKENEAIEMVDKVFLELKDLRPRPSTKTLRSHMTALWYKTLAGLQDQAELPLKLFSIGPRFRREQRQDSHHLYESTSASVVIMDKGYTMEEGREFTRTVMRGLGFGEPRFKVKETTSNYYAPGTDTEIMVDIEGREVEIANIGLYSQKSLDNYDIKYPVFNLGFGVERLAMIKTGCLDLRNLVYPQFYPEARLNDEEIAQAIGMEKQPETEEGRQLVKTLVKSALAHKDDIGPVEVTAFEGEFLGYPISIRIYNWDEGKRMLSFAALNEVYVHNGGLFSLPPKEAGQISAKVPKVFQDAYQGVATGLCFIDLLANRFVAELEGRAGLADQAGPADRVGPATAVSKEKLELDLKFKLIKRPGEINIYIPDNVYNYIMSKNQKILIGGPVFAGIKV